MSSSILRVVERECRRWELRQAEQRARAKAAEFWPVITVSREFGALGEAVARLVAVKTGFAFWDGELVHAIAAQSGANETILRLVDEHPGSGIDDSIKGALMGGKHMKGEYFRALVKLIQSIANGSGSVIVGRGAQYVLGPERSLRVRVVQPLADRIRSYAERQGLDEFSARKKVEREDRVRRAFVREYFSRDGTDPCDYDIVVNTGNLPLERARDVILQAYESKFDRRPSLATSTVGAMPLFGP